MADYRVYIGKPRGDLHCLAAATVWGKAFGVRRKPLGDDATKYLIVVYTVVDGLPVAAATLSTVCDGACNVQAVGAHPSGRGYGTVLMENLLSFSGTLSTPCPVLYLHMDRGPRMPSIARFYERFDFRVAPAFMAMTDDDGVAMARIAKPCIPPTRGSTPTARVNPDHID
jgi:hypothetical protein